LLTSVARESLPLSATALHGRGDAALAAFRNATAAGALLRFTRVRSAFDALAVDDVLAEQLDLLHAWFLTLPAARARGICEEPAFAVWLRDAECRLSGDAAAPPASELLAFLPYVFLRSLAEIAPDRVWALAIPPTTRLMPIGLGFYFVPETSGVTPATFRSAAGFDLVLADGRQARSVPRRRTFLDIEHYEADTFPELTRAALPAIGIDVRDYLARAMGVLVDAWPACIPDIVTVFRAVVVLNAPSGHVYSSSSENAPFVMQLTIRENESRMVLAEMIVHEAAHLKLHLLTTLDPLVVDDGERRYTHPWRTDLRPITGVLFGVHAFLNILVMYEQALRNGVEAVFAANEIRMRRGEVHEALATLGRHARFTSAGAELYADMCEVAGFRS
jgi:HEXXH motif-containing protein